MASKEENPKKPEDEPHEKPPLVIDDFEILEQIGSGAFSHVHIAKHVPTGCYCAAKIIELHALKEEEFVGIMREVSVFMHVDHPNICNLYRMSYNDTQLVFFMEYASRGTLLDYVNGKGGLTEFEAQRYFIQIFSALRHLHIYHFLVHRDLKLENILIDSKGNMKVTDFGLAGTYYNNLMRTFVGTAGYQPPEILAGNDYDEKCDVWSLGVCLYAMITGKLPFSTQNNNYRKLVEDATNISFPKNFSPALVDLLKKMFMTHPNQRPTLIQLQTHPWLKGVQQLGSNIAPQPVMFYKVPSISVIKKFKRKSFKPDSKILEQCVKEKGIDADQLTDMLVKGLSTPETTIYFCYLHPLLKKPEKAAPPPPTPIPQPQQQQQQQGGKNDKKDKSDKPNAPPVPIIPGSRQRKLSNAPPIPQKQGISKVDNKGPRKSSVPLLSQTTKPLSVNLTPHKVPGRSSSTNKSSPILQSANRLIKKPVMTPTVVKRKPL